MKMNSAGRRPRLGTLLLSLLSIVMFVAPMLATSETAATASTLSGATISATPSPQALPNAPWTAVGSTGVVDESALGIFAFGTTDVGYNPTSTSTSSIYVRYNVTNTFDNNANPAMPGWKNLELGSVAPPGSEVRATFYRVKPCDGSRTRICTTNNAAGGGPLCTTCEFSPNFGPVDFSEFLYYVEVQMLRTASAFGGIPSPKAFTLRVY